MLRLLIFKLNDLRCQEVPQSGLRESSENQEQRQGGSHLEQTPNDDELRGRRSKRKREKSITKSPYRGKKQGKSRESDLL